MAASGRNGTQTKICVRLNAVHSNRSRDSGEGVMRLCNGTAALGILVVLFAAAGIARAQPGGDCGALANLKIENTNLLSAAIVPAGGGLPEYCRVLGYVRPAINFEVR